MRRFPGLGYTARNIFARYLIVSLLITPGTSLFAQEVVAPPPIESGDLLTDPVPDTTVPVPEPISPTESIDAALQDPAPTEGSVLGETTTEEAAKMLSLPK